MGYGKSEWGRWLKASYEKTTDLLRGLGFSSTSNEEPLESLGFFGHDLSSLIRSLNPLH